VKDEELANAGTAMTVVPISIVAKVELPEAELII
jgi:hypothetical protein